MKKLNLTGSQWRNLILVFTLVAVVIVIIFIKKDPADNPVLNDNQEEVSEEVETNDSKEEVSSEGATVSDPNKEKFNLALSSGSKAVLAGDYVKAIAFYNEAIGYKDSDVVYARLFSVYLTQNNIPQAMIAIDTAIKLNPKYTDYWNTKIAFLDDRTQASFADLKAVYADGLAKVDPKTKINLVTSFALVAENNGQVEDAVSLYQYAKNLYPANADVYQQEIDRLKK